MPSAARPDPPSAAPRASGALLPSTRSSYGWGGEAAAMPKALVQRWTKVVVRKLPPTLQEQAFRDALDKVCGDDSSAWRWIIFCPGKQR